MLSICGFNHTGLEISYYPNGLQTCRDSFVSGDINASSPDLIKVFQTQTKLTLTLTQFLLQQLFILNLLAHYWPLVLPTELSSEQPATYPHRTTETPRLVIIPEPEVKMVQATAGSTGSSSREYGIIFEIGPPDAVRPGLPFTLPVVVAVRPMGSPGNGSAQQLVANISLRTESGTCTSGLSGTLTSSVRSRNGNTVPGYAEFSPITIFQSGRYRLRVMLSAASQSGVTTKEFVDSNVIQVHGGAPATQKPTAAQISKLQRLTAENIDISEADIAAWQRA